MSKEDSIEYDGVVSEVLAGGSFTVKISEDHEVLAHLGGRIRKNKIRVVLGDHVKVAVSPYDPTRGRIVYRAR